MYWYEWKKILFRRKGILLILLFLAAKLVLLSFFTESDNAALAAHTDSCRQWFSLFGGQLDEEKTIRLNELSDEYLERSGDLRELYADYSEGVLTDTELEEGLLQWDAFVEDEESFDVIYSQYLYAVSDPDHRYLLDTNAWAGLLADESLNYPLILVIALLALLTFGSEQKSEMDQMIRTTRLGERRAVSYKLWDLLALTVGLSLLDEGMEIACYQIRYGFTHAEYPLQSLSFFSSSTLEISLGCAALLLFLLKTVGYVFFLLLACFLIRLTGRYAVSAVVLFASILIPNYGITPEYICYYLPLPVGFLRAAGYLLGTQYAASAYEGQERQSYLFRALGKGEFCLLAAAVAILSAAIVWYLRQSYSNFWAGRAKRRGAVAVILCVSALLSGCGQASSDSASVRIYNEYNRIADESAAYIIYPVVTDDSSTLYYRSKQTGESGNVMSDVFSDSKMYYYWPVFVDETHLYYLMMTNKYDRANYSNGTYDTFQIMRLDFETFDTEIYYICNGLSNPSLLYGIGSYHDADAEFYTNIENFWVDGDMVYMLESGEIWTLNRKTGIRTRLLADLGTSTVSYDRRNFYYLDSRCRLHIYEIESGTDAVCDDVIADSCFLLAEGGVVYPNCLDGGKLYYYTWEDGAARKLLDETPFGYQTDGTRLFYYEYGESAMELWGLELCEPDAESVLLISGVESSGIYPLRAYESLLLYKYETYEITDIPKTGE